MEKIYAQVDIKGIAPGGQFQTWGSLVNVILRNALVLAGVVGFILLIVTGFQFIVAAGGDTKKYDQAKKSILTVLLGLALVAGAVFLVQIIEALTGLKLLSP